MKKTDQHNSQEYQNIIDVAELLSDLLSNMVAFIKIHDLSEEHLKNVDPEERVNKMLNISAVSFIQVKNDIIKTRSQIIEKLDQDSTSNLKQEFEGTRFLLIMFTELALAFIEILAKDMVKSQENLPKGIKGILAQSMLENDFFKMTLGYLQRETRKDILQVVDDFIEKRKEEVSKEQDSLESLLNILGIKESDENDNE